MDTTEKYPAGVAVAVHGSGTSGELSNPMENRGCSSATPSLLTQPHFCGFRGNSIGEVT